MQGKSCVLASKRLEYAIDAVSKATLLDLVVDRARAEIGENATDEAVVELVQKWLDPVVICRGGKIPNLENRLKLIDKASEKYRHLQAKPEGVKIDACN